MKLVAHESPISIQGLVRQCTDYDYALVHLLEEKTEYLKFFEESLNFGRKVILDNSIFELGSAFDPEKFAYWIKKLRPTEYIIPDVLEDTNGTLLSLLKWIKKYQGKVEGKSIGVVQGKSYEDLVTCYWTVSKCCDKIAISFNYSYYEELFPHPNKLVSWMMGRVLVLSRMLKEGIIDTTKPHHLLGCSLPQEFSFYKDKKFDFIESIDTSNPIVHGLYGIHYGDEGLWTKTSTPLFTLIEEKVSSHQWDSILYNINRFKSFVN
jgi:hypothetical protein